MNSSRAKSPPKALNVPNQANNATRNDMQNHSGITEFNSSIKIEAARFGYKASRLADAHLVSELGIFLPFGFCISSSLV